MHRVWRSAVIALVCACVWSGVALAQTLAQPSSGPVAISVAGGLAAGGRSAGGTIGGSFAFDLTDRVTIETSASSTLGMFSLNVGYRF